MNKIHSVDFTVELSARVRDYIKDHGGTITLSEAPQTGCCSHYVFVGASLGEPTEEGYYGLMEQAGIKIYYDPLVVKEGKNYEIDLEGFLRWKTIVVY